ncbi:MAG TPA: ribosomal protein S18-alanine N-acetyltransferase [Methanomassiliicoccales archaeon]|jgi:N6-L-threonylcarbamoyladenine synthase/ribosomal-protein-alanine N-acetyltransferase
MRVREATPQDLDDLMRIEEESFQEERFNRDLLEMFVNEEEFETLVCEMDGIVVGYATAYTEPGVKSRVLSLAVDKRHRGRGIGVELMREIEHRARTLRSNSVSLEVRVTNEVAVNLYLKEGYRIKGTIPDYYSKGEDAFYMEKKL